MRMRLPMMPTAIVSDVHLADVIRESDAQKALILRLAQDSARERRSQHGDRWFLESPRAAGRAAAKAHDWQLNCGSG